MAKNHGAKARWGGRGRTRAEAKAEELMLFGFIFCLRVTACTCGRMTDQAMRSITWGWQGERAKMSRRDIFAKRYRPKQGAQGESLRPTQDDYATAEGRARAEAKAEEHQLFGSGY